MIQAKSIFIIPGYNHTPSYSAYRKITILLQNKGYSPIPVTIPWKQNITQNTDYFLKEFKKITGKKKYILGFSFGAMIALLASTKVSVNGLILCSLSPYFKEDLPKISKSDYARIKKLYYNDFTKLSFQKMAKKTKAKQILMLYGAREATSLKNRVSETYNEINLKNKYLLPISRTEHNIGDYKYLNKISKIIKLLK